MGLRTSRIRSSTSMTKDKTPLRNEDIYSIPNRKNKNMKPPRPRLVDEEEFRKICQSSIRGFLTRSRRAKQPRFNLNRQPQMTPNKKVEEWLHNTDNILAEPPSGFERGGTARTSSGHLKAPESIILELLQRVHAEVQAIRDTTNISKKEELLEGMEEAILYDICYVERRLEERRSQRRSMRQPRLSTKAG